MRKEIELLAPGGDVESIKAAITAGANAVYCGLGKFNARNRAANLDMDTLYGIIELAHDHDCQIFLTLNIIILENELTELINLLNLLVNSGIDAIIIQDWGVFYLLKKYFPSLHVHASTQCTTHNRGQILFLKELGAERVNLSRELNAAEIKNLTELAHQNHMHTEIFVHGSYCISFSGVCYFSSVTDGNSGNRGRCSQPCRNPYNVNGQQEYFFNMKDNCAAGDLDLLTSTGADSYKIEGRIKKPHYVYTVVKEWQKLLHNDSTNPDLTSFYSVFNRDYSSGYLTDDINAGMFTTNHRNHAAHQLAENNNISLDDAATIIDHNTKELIDVVNKKVENYAITKHKVTIRLSGKTDSYLEVDIITTNNSFRVFSKSKLRKVAGKADHIIYSNLSKRLTAINQSNFTIDSIEYADITPDLTIPFGELTTIRNEIFLKLTGQEFIKPVEFPKLKSAPKTEIKPELAILINDEKDLSLIDNAGNIFYQLPENLSSNLNYHIKIFQSNKKLIPWFQSIYIDADYDAAVEFLKAVKPALIITNNSGIAYSAKELGIDWIAGPNFNIVNSYSLLCLQELGCTGAFISNELSNRQIKRIKKPTGFALYYSIYHPIMLMESRQCLFQYQDCSKDKMDKNCLKNCKRTQTINPDNPLIIDKQPGNYHKLYSGTHYLNTDITGDIQNTFSCFMIDITKTTTDKATLIKKINNGQLKIHNASNDLK